MGARRPAPAERGRGSPLGPHAGRCHPPLSIVQSRGPSLPSPSARRGGETRCYKPRPPPTPCHSALPRCLLSPVLGVICKRGSLTLPPVSCSPGPPRPCARGSGPKGQGRSTVFPFPLWLRGLHGKIPLSTMPLVTRLGRGRTMGSPHHHSAPWLQAFLSDHG